MVDFVDVGIECTLRQLLEHGYFHADPHPGAAAALGGWVGGWVVDTSPNKTEPRGGRRRRAGAMC